MHIIHHLGQENPYVIYKKHGQTLDKFGNIVDKKSLEAHIPLDEFLFLNKMHAKFFYLRK